MLFILIAFFNLQSFAESPNPPRAGRYEGRGTFSYYSTESNYSSTNASVLLRDQYMTQMMGELEFIYDWQPDWRFSGGANFSAVETDNGTFSRNNSGPNEVFVSAQKWYELGPFDIAPQGDFFYPMWRVDDASDDALIGEGGMRARGGSWLFWPNAMIHPFAYLGFEYRDEGRSFLLPYSAGVKIKNQLFYVQGEFRGYETVVDDADSKNEINRQVYLDRVNGGSQRFYSINPSVGEVAVEAGTRLGSWGIFAGFAISIFGDNMADGWAGYGGISFSPALVSTARREAPSFNTRPEVYDESLFTNEVDEPLIYEKPKAAPVAPVARPKPPPRAVESKPVDIQLQLRRVPPKKKKNPKLDKMMKETERALEKAD